MDATHNLIAPSFEHHTIPNEAASRTAGRPVFDNLEVIRIRFAGDRQKVAVFPAHDIDPNATRDALAAGTIATGEYVTYAQAYAPLYRKFKEGAAQDLAGTPLSEAPFLDNARRSELKALNIHTVEALAALDGNPLKQLGMGGRELKNQAQAYLDRARGSADVTAMAAQIAALQQQLAERDRLIEDYASEPKKGVYQRGVEAAAEKDPYDGYDLLDPTPVELKAEKATADGSGPRDTGVADGSADGDTSRPIEDLSDAELKEFIKAQTGKAVRGNPSRDTLEAQAIDLARKADAIAED